MNTNILTDISRNLLGAGYLDVQFLVNTIEENNLDFDDIYENVEMNFGEDFKADINTYIYEALSQIAYKFIDSHQDIFKTENILMRIYTNYMDSHIWFNSEKIQSEFERF